jgi:hypothetical protein
MSNVSYILDFDKQNDETICNLDMIDDSIELDMMDENLDTVKRFPVGRLNNANEV